MKKHIGNYLNATPDQYRPFLKSWAESITSNSIKKIKETALYDDFSQKFLQNILGYQSIATSSENYTLSQNQTIAGGEVEYALGHFGLGKEAKVISPLELKGARIDLDAIMSGRNKTPVQQAWEYAMDAKGAQWVLVSNYLEIRLYAIGYGRKDYERFDLSTLTQPEAYARFVLVLSAQNLLGEVTRSLLRESEEINKHVTNQLYKDYKELRGNLIHVLTQNNPEIPTLDIIGHVQTILDRVLFIAFAEDKGLLPKDTLKEAYKTQNRFNPQPVWTNFVGLFHAIDQGNTSLNVPGYNGGLFRHTPMLDTLNMSDKLCEEFKRLGEYDFDSDISVNILGHIFEQSIADLEEIKVSVSGEVEYFDKKKSKRKKDGI